MKTVFFSLICTLFAIVAFAQQQKQIPPKADTLYKHLMAAARPAVKTWVKTTAAKYAGKDLSQEQAMNEVKQATTLGNLGDGDIMAIAFLVMMETAKAAQEDLKSVMAGVKSINDAKARQRQQISTVKMQPGTIKVDSPHNTKLSDATKMAEPDKNKKDALSEMSETNQLRMQMYMDRRNKMIDALSNILKKVSDTEQQVIQNLK
ncbi:MAG: hypothetical protein JST86_19230 [Bacteroidetes bacterium]|nr:hypothetical protein [Bacteroidota bacterium]